MIKNNAKLISQLLIVTCSTLLFFSGTSYANKDNDFNGNEEGIKLFNTQQYQRAETYFLERVSHLSKQQEKALQYQQVIVYLSKISLGKQENEEAVEYIEEALSVKIPTVEDLLLAGNIYCKYAREVSIFSALSIGKKCIKQYEKAIALYPSNTKALYTAVQFHLYAPSLVGGSIEKAAQYLLQLERISDEATHLLKVQYSEVTDDEKAAMALAEKYSQHSYKSTEHQYQLAMYFRENKRYQESKKLLQNIILTTNQATLTERELSWHENDSWLQLGEIYLEEGDEKSLEYIQEYLSRNNDPFDPHYYWARWSFAKAHYEAGNLSKYKEIVADIKKQNYKKDDDFKERFIDGLKKRNT